MPTATDSAAAGRAPTPARRRAFVRRLLRWYRAHRRDLPWRRTSDPYRILVSEIMLQQTQVDRVIPKYHEFLRRYPSIAALARAPVDRVRETWYPLGYNIRPVRLHAIAREVITKHDGRIPDDRESLLRLKGIGPYTAGAVLAFAYGQPVPIVDTNVRRVLQRVFLGRTTPGDAALWRLARDLLPRRAAYDFNQGLMDLGATVCVARAPRCAICPVRGVCRAAPRFARERAARGAPGASASTAGSPRIPPTGRAV
jgi:A/G-specific adenine glycosylase